MIIRNHVQVPALYFITGNTRVFRKTCVMKKFIFSAAILFAATCLHAQEVQFPLEDGTISIEKVVILPDSLKAAKIAGRIKTWASQKAAMYGLSQQQSAVGNTFKWKAYTKIQDADGDNNNAVYASFDVKVTYANGRYRYEIEDLAFIKNNHTYDASEVYKGYLEGDPVVKTTFEKPSAAVNRHGFLLKQLDNKIKELTASLQQKVMNA
jgi:hypothetical protein